MATKAKKEVVVLTQDELTAIQRAAIQVWDEIGDDWLTVALEEHPRGKRGSIPRSEVVEAVQDADRLTMQLRRAGLSDLAKKYAALPNAEQDRIVSLGFRAERYGY